MADLEDIDDLIRVIDRVNDPVIPLPDPEKVPEGKLAAALRFRVIG